MLQSVEEGKDRMKAQMKAVVTSAIVVVLALAAVSGVTYSWFSDSDSADVTISTAVIDIEASFAENVFEDGAETTDTIDINGKIDGWLGDQRNIDFWIKNSSTTKIVWRATATVTAVYGTEAIEGTTIKDKMSPMTVYGQEVTGTENATSENGTYKWTSDPIVADWVGADVSETPIKQSIPIDYTGTGNLNGIGLSINLRIDAYPSDYKQTTETSADGTATVKPSDVTPGGVTVTGTTQYGTDEDAKEIGVSISFNKTAADSIAENGGEVKIESANTGYTAMDGGSVIAAIDVTIPEGTMNNGSADVTITIPGIHTNILVVHADDIDKPITPKSVTSVGNETVVTFTATHFSVYSVQSGVAADDSSTLASMLNAGGAVVLTSDVETNETLVVPKGKVVSLNLNGFKITGTMHCSAGDVIKNEGTLTVIGGTIESTAENGGSAIENFGILTVEDCVLTGAPRSGAGWPAYVVDNYGTATITGTTAVGNHGVFATQDPTDGEATVEDKMTLSDVNATVNGIGSSSHIVYASGEVTIESGVYEHKGNGYGYIGYLFNG